MNWLLNWLKKTGNSILDHNRTWAKDELDYLGKEIKSRLVSGVSKDSLTQAIISLATSRITNAQVLGAVLLGVHFIIDSLDFAQPIVKVQAQVDRLVEQAKSKVESVRF